MSFTTNETYEIKLFKRLPNSAYGYETNASSIFYGRPANTVEKKSYRLQKGVNTQNTSTMVFCSNLPDNINDGDKVQFLGRTWTVMSIGYYLIDNRIVNANCFSEEYLISQCPKGLSLE